MALMITAASALIMITWKQSSDTEVIFALPISTPGNMKYVKYHLCFLWMTGIENILNNEWITVNIVCLNELFTKSPQTRLISGLTIDIVQPGEPYIIQFLTCRLWLNLSASQWKHTSFAHFAIVNKDSRMLLGVVMLHVPESLTMRCHLSLSFLQINAIH